MAAAPSNRVFAASQKREILIAIVAGILVLALLIYGILTLGNNATSATINGRIISKTFTPQEEQQISLGAGGLRSIEKKGRYQIQVKALPDGEIYNVWLDEKTYNTLKIGDSYQILKAALAAD